MIRVESPVPSGWRLIRHGAGHGAFNMGVDEALLDSATEGIATLRFYAWEGPWLSLGYSQGLDPRRFAACARAGVGIVRRATGGGAVLHGEDLTYCLAAPEAALPEGLRGSYRLVGDALVEALRTLGLAVQRNAGPSETAASRGFDCFEVSAEDEISVIGRKLVGSAQRRARGGVLQHGSIRLAPDPLEVTRAPGFAPGVATSLAELGVLVGKEEVEEALTAAFRSALGTPMEDSVLSASELLRAERRQELHGRDLGEGARRP